MERTKIIIMGAAGRDFHNFNVCFRDRKDVEVVAFTATQIPDIHGRRYPPKLAGKLYPKGIPIYAEEDIEKLIKKHKVEQVVFAYSDLPYEYVMQRSAVVNSAGADFVLMGPERTMLSSSKPVVAICAVRTGAGKSQTSRKVFQYFRNKGLKVVSIRHPMPYDEDLTSQTCQRFASYKDLDKYRCTIEEREEYEPYIDMGGIVYAGVDYEKILREAEKEADIIIWDGGNNDFSFYKSDLYITIADPHRPGHEISYYPGEVNVRLADVVIINKVETAYPEDIDEVRYNITRINPDVVFIDGASPVFVDDPDAIRGKRVVVVEDGPTVTHGNMPYGAGAVAASKFGALELVDVRALAVGSIRETFDKYPHLENIVPAMGYGIKQIKDLQKTLNAADCDIVIGGTPIDLNRIIKINKPIVRVRYELQEIGVPTLNDVLDKFVKRKKLA